MAGESAALSASSVTAGATTYTAYSALSPRFCTTVGHGNSLTLDYFDEMSTRLAANQASHTKQIWYAVNKATGGLWTTQLAAEFTAVVQRFYNPRRLCLLQFCELSNHTGAGSTWDVIRDATIAYCANARGLGWKLAFHIPTPRAQRSDPGYSGSASAWRVGELTTFNTVCDFFRAHTEHYDFALDLAAVSELSNPLNLTYYQADGCHLTAAGIAAKAAAVAAATAAWVF
jgi:hypothetical protein